MPKHLDYEFLMNIDMPEELQQFLLTVNGAALERRVCVSFPEFFTDENNQSVVHWVSLAKRAIALQRAGYSGIEMLHKTLSWFGLELCFYLDNEGEALDEDSVISLSDDNVSRWEKLEDFTSEEVWCAAITTGTQTEEGVVLGHCEVIIDPEKPDLKRMLFLGIPAEHITTDPLPYEEVAIGQD